MEEAVCTKVIGGKTFYPVVTPAGYDGGSEIHAVSKAKIRNETGPKLLSTCHEVDAIEEESSCKADESNNDLDADGPTA